jgi:integrase/recombinase XerD
MEKQGKSKNTIASYLKSVELYLEWFHARYDKYAFLLFRENIDDYKDHLNTTGVKASTFNARMSGLKLWNEFLIEKGIQKEMVIQKKDKKRIQQQYASPAKHSEQEINQFIQSVLEGRSKRDYALVVLSAYTGLRISEALELKLDEIHLEAKELEVKDGKGNKARTVLLSDRVVRAINNYLNNERDQYRLAGVSPYLFLSNRSRKLSRITAFKLFKGYSQKAGINPPISPHDLRHFFCSNALEKGLNIHEVASLAGHSNIHTTLLYTNPDRQNMLRKLNQL